MRIVDAVWEKRNLGVDSAEITLQDGDGTDVFTEISGLTYPYQVLKIPNGRVDLITEAQNNNFFFVESQLNIISHFGQPNFTPLVSRFLNDIKFEEAEENDVNIVLKEISTGEIFKTDRIALDPQFSCEIAGKRYANWIKDTLDSGSGVLLVSKKKGEPLGFVSISFKDNFADAILGGTLSSNKVPAMGIAAAYAGILYAKQRGCDYIVSAVSCNNIPAIKINLAAGYSVENSSYVFVKHLM